MTKNLACEWAKDNIRVNSVAPAVILTPLIETAIKVYIIVIIFYDILGFLIYQFSTNNAIYLPFEKVLLNISKVKKEFIFSLHK